MEHQRKKKHGQQKHEQMEEASLLTSCTLHFTIEAKITVGPRVRPPAGGQDLDAQAADTPTCRTARGVSGWPAFPPVSSATFEPWSVLLPGCVCESGPTAIVEVATLCLPFGPSFVSRGQTRGQSDPKNVTSLRALVLHCMQATPSGSCEDSHRPAAGQGTVRRVPALLTASSGGAGAAGRAQHTPRASRRGWPR